VFLFNASERLQQGIEQEYKLESLYDSEEIQLMKLVSKAETTNK
jgi:hypothetical protein